MKIKGHVNTIVGLGIRAGNAEPGEDGTITLTIDPAEADAIKVATVEVFEEIERIQKYAEKTELDMLDRIFLAVLPGYVAAAAAQGPDVPHTEIVGAAFRTALVAMVERTKIVEAKAKTASNGKTAETPVVTA